MNHITLDVDHPNKKRMEYFLNNVRQELQQVPFDWRGLKRANDIIAGYKFKGGDQSLTITVFFTDSYHEANEIAKANSFPAGPNARWSLNGDLLYVVEASDENIVSNILGLFAGEE